MKLSSSVSGLNQAKRVLASSSPSQFLFYGFITLKLLDEADVYVNAQNKEKWCQLRPVDQRLFQPALSTPGYFMKCFKIYSLWNVPKVTFFPDITVLVFNSSWGLYAYPGVHSYHGQLSQSVTQADLRFCSRRFICVCNYLPSQWLIPSFPYLIHTKSSLSFPREPGLTQCQHWVCDISIHCCYFTS